MVNQPVPEVGFAVAVPKLLQLPWPYPCRFRSIRLIRVPTLLPDALGMPSIGRHDLDQIVVEHGAMPHVRLELGGGGVRVLAVGGVLRPPD